MEETKFLNIYKLKIYQILTFLIKITRNTEQLYETISDKCFSDILLDLVKVTS